MLRKTNDTDTVELSVVMKKTQ